MSRRQSRPSSRHRARRTSMRCSRCGGVPTRVNVEHSGVGRRNEAARRRSGSDHDRQEPDPHQRREPDTFRSARVSPNGPGGPAVVRLKTRLEGAPSPHSDDDAGCLPHPRAALRVGARRRAARAVADADIKAATIQLSSGQRRRLERAEGCHRGCRGALGRRDNRTQTPRSVGVSRRVTRSTGRMPAATGALGRGRQRPPRPSAAGGASPSSVRRPSIETCRRPESAFELFRRSVGRRDLRVASRVAATAAAELDPPPSDETGWPSSSVSTSHPGPRSASGAQAAYPQSRPSEPAARRAIRRAC